MIDEASVRAALHEVLTAEQPRICRCMHVIAGGGAWLDADDVRALLGALANCEASFALTGDAYPDLRPLFGAVHGLDRVWREAPDSLRAEFGAQLVEAGGLSASELDSTTLDAIAARFLEGGSRALERFAETDLFDRIVAQTTRGSSVYSVPFESFFGVCGAERAARVLEGIERPEKLSAALAASSIPSAWISEWATGLPQRAPTKEGARALLCAALALVARGEALPEQLSRAVAEALPHADSISTPQGLLPALAPEQRSRLLVTSFDWSLVEPQTDDAALDRTAEELLAGRVHGPYDEGLFGASALSALVRLGPQGLEHLCNRRPELDENESSRWLLAEARHLFASATRLRSGPLARERDAVAASLATEAMPTGRALIDLWSALGEQPGFIVPPELHADLAAFGVERPERGRWLIAPVDHPLHRALYGRSAYRRVIELQAPSLLVRHHEAVATESERAFEASPRRDELRYVDQLPVGYRRVLELVHRSIRRIVNTLKIEPRHFNRAILAVLRCERSGPRRDWPEPEDDVEDDAPDTDERVAAVVSASERLVQELSLWGARDDQSRPVELELAFAMLWLVEQGEPPSRRALARSWFEAWLDEDVPAVAALTS